MATAATVNHRRELTYIAYLYRNPEAFQRFRLSEDLFGYRPAKILFFVIHENFKRHGSVPSQEELEFLITDFGTKNNWTPVMREGVWDDCQAMLTIEITEATADDLRKYVLQRDVHRVGESLTGWDSDRSVDELDSVRKQIEFIQGMGSDLSDEDIGIFPFAEAILTDPYSYISELQDPRRRVPMFCAKVLTNLLEGGIRPGELAIILGSTGVGKSLVMLNIGCGLTMETNRRCLYFAMDNTKAEMMERIYATVSGHAIAAVPHMADREPWRQDIVRGVRGPNTRFLLKQLPPQAATVDDLRRIVRKAKEYWQREDDLFGIEEEDRDLAIGIFDYMECIRPTRQREHYRFELKDTADALSCLCQEEDLAGLTGAQGNRDSLTRQTPDLKNFSESYSQAFIASVIMALCQQDHERALGQFRIALVKARRSANRFQVYMQVDYKNLRISDRLDSNGALIDAVPLGTQQNLEAGMAQRSTTSSSAQTDYSKSEYGGREHTEAQDLGELFGQIKMAGATSPTASVRPSQTTTSSLSSTPVPAEIAKRQRQRGSRR